MYDYDVARAAPPEDVMCDDAGSRTYDSCYRAKAIFGVERVILVSQRFHLPRAIFTCRSLGIDSVGFAADRRVYGSESYNRLREGFASVAAWWDVTVAHPLPVLGEREEMGV